MATDPADTTPTNESKETAPGETASGFPVEASLALLAELLDQGEAGEGTWYGGVADAAAATFACASALDVAIEASDPAAGVAACQDVAVASAELLGSAVAGDGLPKPPTAPEVLLAPMPKDKRGNPYYAGYAIAHKAYILAFWALLPPRDKGPSARMLTLPWDEREAIVATLARYYSVGDVLWGYLAAGGDTNVNTSSVVSDVTEELTTWLGTATGVAGAASALGGGVVAGVIAAAAAVGTALAALFNQNPDWFHLPVYANGNVAIEWASFAWKWRNEATWEHTYNAPRQMVKPAADWTVAERANLRAPSLGRAFPEITLADLANAPPPYDPSSSFEWKKNEAVKGVPGWGVAALPGIATGDMGSSASEHYKKKPWIAPDTFPKWASSIRSDLQGALDTVRAKANAPGVKIPSGGSTSSTSRGGIGAGWLALAALALGASR